MLLYWLIFAVPLPAIFIDPNLRSRTGEILWITLVITCIFFVGLRYRVGCDWQNYYDLYYAIKTNTDFGISTVKDVISWGPLFLALNWLGSYSKYGFYFINLTCAALSLVGLAIFCRGLTAPWLSWTLAYPYLVVVVTMGYTRQSVAIGLFLCGLHLLQKGKPLLYAGIILCAAMFHISAILLLPLTLTYRFRSNPYKYSSAFILFFIIFALLLGPDAIDQIERYINSNQISRGAIIRSLMTLVPAIILLLYYRKLAILSEIIDLWAILSIAAILSFCAVWFMSTAVDRVSLYLIPLQLFVWSTIPSLIQQSRYKSLVLTGIISYCTAILFVWLVFGYNNRCWLPYQNVFFKHGIF